MAQETKAVITRADCKKVLFDEVKALIPLTVVFTLLSIILVLILIPFDQTLISYLCESTFDLYSIICIVCIILVTLAFGGPLVLEICVITDLCCRIYDLKKGNFTIVEDTLAQIVIGEAVKRFWHKHTHYYDVFYFKYSGRYVISEPRKKLLEFSSEGDKFYIVVFNRKKQEPLLVYHANIYEWKE